MLNDPSPYLPLQALYPCSHTFPSVGILVKKNGHSTSSARLQTEDRLTEQKKSEHFFTQSSDMGESRQPVWSHLQWPFIGFFIFPMFSIFFSKGILYRNGGIVGYIIHLILGLVFIPLIYLVTRLGSVTQCHIVTLLGRYIPVMKGLGVASLFYVAVILLWASSLAMFSSLYLFKSLGDSNMTWLTCSNHWNTGSCVSLHTLRNQYVSVNHSLAAEEFFISTWDNENLNASTAGHLFLVYLCVFLVIAWGPKIYGWITVSGGVLGCLLVAALTVRGLTLPDGRAMLSGLMRPSFGLVKLDIVQESITQWMVLPCFLVGLLPSYGHFAGQSGFRSTLSFGPVALSAMISPLIIFVMMVPYFDGYYHIIHYTDVYSVFISMASSLAVVGRVWLVVYYLMTFLACLSFLCFGMIVILESAMVGLSGFRQRTKWNDATIRVMLSAILCMACFLLALPEVTSFRLYFVVEAAYTMSVFYETPLLICILVVFARNKDMGYYEKAGVPIVAGIGSLFLVGFRIYYFYEFATYIATQDAGHNALLYCTTFGCLILGCILGLLHAIYLSKHNTQVPTVAYLFSGNPEDTGASNAVPTQTYPMQPCQTIAYPPPVGYPAQQYPAPTQLPTATDEPIDPASRRDFEDDISSSSC